MLRIRPLPISVAERMASVPWLRRQSAHELARLMAVKAARGRHLRAVTQPDRPQYRMHLQRRNNT
jgi:hypothetical protein